MLKESESEEGSTYECTQNGCLMSFNKLEDLDLHLEIGQHKHYMTGSVYDQLKIDWVSKFSALTIDEGRELDKRGNVGNRLGCSDFSMGWALHEPKGGGSGYSDNIREYLTAKYDLGETTGNKCDPQQVADDMRNSKLEHGERWFSREEWLSKAQIRSFFSRIRAARRKQALLQSERQIDVDSDDDFGPWLQEVESLDQAVEENKFRD